MQGRIAWRYYSDEADVCIMNDVIPTTGVLSPNAFVHVMKTIDFAGQDIIKCTCSIFNFICHAAHHANPHWPFADTYPDAETSCPHCRFYNEFLQDAFETASNNTLEDLNVPLRMVKKSLGYFSEEVLLLGNVIPSSTTKFSVKEHSGEYYACVHVTFTHGKCMLTCADGMCRARMHNKKRVPQSASIKDTENLCVHLCTISLNFDTVKKHFPEYFLGDDKVDEKHDQIVQDDEEDNIQFQHYANNDDVNIALETEGNFDRATGLWQFKSETTHKPMEQFDVNLIKNTRLRNLESCKDPEVTLVKIQPSHTNEDGSQKQCGCGSEYAADGFYVKGFATLYTRLGAIKCQYSNLKCTSGNCEIPYAEAAAEQGICFSTTVTCAGDEIGWDFITDVLKKMTSFSAFCAEMSIKYRTNNPMAASFMSTNTFISYFFGWLYNMRIDFRKEVDPEYGYKPQILACDGTHIGVSMKHMKLENPITKNDVPMQLSSQHQHLQRTMIGEKEPRAHLRYFCNKFLGKLKQKDFLTQQQEEVCKRELLAAINTKAGICNFVTMFLHKQVPDEMLKEMAKLLHMLSGDACMSSVFPFEGNPYITRACAAISTNNLQAYIMDKIKEYNKEVVCLFI